MVTHFQLLPVTFIEYGQNDNTISLTKTMPLNSLQQFIEYWKMIGMYRLRGEFGGWKWVRSEVKGWTGIEEVCLLRNPEVEVSSSPWFLWEQRRRIIEATAGEDKFTVWFQGTKPESKSRRTPTTKSSWEPAREDMRKGQKTVFRGFFESLRWMKEKGLDSPV